ncbi:MAG: ankyrin repeat domain-containing protein [Alphaproteobacteria bacterium]|nr:ankyrin repeat domain-containing protein [Alphaproteobacteria bacterium]
MKSSRFLGFLLLLMPGVACGASSDFQNAAKLLTAARRGDIQSVQMLINAGADVNYVDSTGVSLICTAVMNNDKKAIQILQMYGADASNCDRQIKKYKQKSTRAAKGEEYGFFSGLSSSHILALSAVGVAGIVGGLYLLTDVLDSDNGNSSSSSGGSHGGGGGGGSSGTWTKQFTIPYGPAYLDSNGNVNTSFDITENLNTWDTQSESALRVTDFNYFRTSSTNNYVLDGLNPLLQNYLLVMHGYYSLASGYMGQNIFRDPSTNAPLKAAIDGAQARPARIALITGNGINPAGSADSADGITYAIGTGAESATPTVDKYLNNNLTGGVETEISGFDFSGSGSAFNPYADVNDSAIAKIVAGWEGNRAANDGDLYGFVPNAQLAIYRTGNGSQWQDVTGPQSSIGLFTDADASGGLSVNDILKIGTNTYTIVTALSQTTVAVQPTVTIDGHTFDLSTNSNLFLAQCNNTTNCTDFAIYVGTDGYFYVNINGGNDIDAVYAVDSSNNIYVKKEKNTSVAYTNFSAIKDAVGRIYSVAGDTSATTVDVIANTNVIPVSRQISYITTKTFTKAASLAHYTDLQNFYSALITNNYGTYNYTLNNQNVYEYQGDVANQLFSNYNSSKPMLIMPAGDYLLQDGSTGQQYLDTLDATFENYAPVLYGNTLKHNFMTVVGVLHADGTSSASTITGYGDGINSGYGKLQLSLWTDSDSNLYSSRKCGIAGSGVAGSGVDPWCFAASGPTAEMATASAAGAVASVKSAFSYMTNDQVFTLLALTADGPYLAASTSGTSYSTDTLVAHLRDMYALPYEYNESSLTNDEYLSAFKDVFGYGLINLQRAINPSFSVYYYNGNVNNIVSSDGSINKIWGKLATSSNSSRASTIFSLTGRGAITTSFYDVLESVDGSLSLPRVWTTTFANSNANKHGLYMGDMLGEFNVSRNQDNTYRQGNLEINMAVSQRAYNDNYGGLDNLKVAFVSEDFDINAEYQHHLTDGESRFNGRANGLLALASNALSTGSTYKSGNFGFGARAFSGTVTDESLLETDPVVSAQFEPGRLGFVNGGALDAKYKNDKVSLDLSFGMMHESDTVLGVYSDGLLGIRGGNTQYVDAVATYKPFDNVKLSLRGTFANTRADEIGGLITNLSDLKSNAFAFGLDVGGFGLTVAMPLAVVDGRMGYGYAEFEVVENNGSYDIAMNNAHTEYVDLAAQHRELRFGTTYKTALGALTDAGVEFMYRVNPNNTNVFGNESVLMFKVQHRVGI